MKIGEWFNMSRPQRIASIILVALIVIVTAVRMSLSRNKPLPEQVEQRALKLARFRADIDSAGIDTATTIKKPKQPKPPAPDRKVEQIPTFDE